MKGSRPRYLALALQYQAANEECTALFVASDDATAVEEVRAMSRGAFRVLSGDIRREKYAVQGAAAGREWLIERRSFSEPGMSRREIALEAVADVVGLSRCDAIVGHLGESVFSQTALLLSFAHGGAVPPFATVNFPMGYYWHYWGGREDFLRIGVTESDCF
jgi:hypothetical protein